MGENTTKGGTPATENKPKRVRTGCLTCRERHLKCDEATPECYNCQRSNKECKRGVRLNFLDTTVKQPPIVPQASGYKISFQDESRDVASEYQGGLDKYAHCDRTVLPPTSSQPQPQAQAKRTIEYELRPQNADSGNSLPPMQSAGNRGDDGLIKQDYAHPRQASRHHSLTGSDGTMQSYLTASTTIASDTRSPEAGRMQHVDNANELLLLQVFVEEVAIWMDSMDQHKNFSRLMPFHALGERMLYDAILACGARHLTLVNPEYHEDKALFYYDTATTQLLRSLQDPERDTVVCATTAVILNVYEIMSERAMQRMNHIAGARALIKECGWNAKSTGIGAACFWLNVGMELLSCLHFNWQVAWDPELWGLDMDMQPETGIGREEFWVHRMLYIVGKVANLRASTPRFQEKTQSAEEQRLKARMEEWNKLTGLCHAWNKMAPRTMQPLGYLQPSQTSSKSAFPEVWLIKRATIVGRLFYHTAMCLLHQISPMYHKDTPQMAAIQLEHAHQICGITAHVKDRGVASVALRSLAIAAEVLHVRREQEEVLQIFGKIRHETGWNVGFLHDELKAKWGWTNEEQALPPPPALLGSLFTTNTNNVTKSQFINNASMNMNTNGSESVPPPAASRPRPPSGIVNPVLAGADFSNAKHPYQQYYQPPAPNQVGRDASGAWFGQGHGWGL